MPLRKYVFRPGINKEGTNYSNEGGWFDADKVTSIGTFLWGCICKI